MRLIPFCSVALLVACGGAPKQPPADVASDTPAPSSTPTEDMPPPADSSAAPTASTAPTAAPPPASTHPVPTASGNVDGKPFAPRLVQVSGPMQKDGRLLVSFNEADDCVTSDDAKPGVATLMMMVPWKDGAKVDLAKLKAANPKKKGFAGMGDATFIRIGDDGKHNQVSTTFKPTGTLTIVSAPMEQNAIGKMTVDLKSGDYALSGNLDIKVCFPPK
jgi:hypothetical protein